MSNTKEWSCLPTGDLTQKTAWRSLGGDRYAALRLRLLFVTRCDNAYKYGNVHESYTRNKGVTQTIRKKSEHIISHTNTFVESVRLAATSRICEKLSAKLTSEVSAKAFGTSMKVGGELVESKEFELTNHVENSLEKTSAFTIQSLESEEYEIKLEGADRKSEIVLRRKYWERHLDVYLHSFEYMELSYRKSWFWWQVRDSIKQVRSGILGKPLVSIRYYEPQENLDVLPKSKVDELKLPDEVTVEELQIQMPKVTAPQLESLEDLAAVAFPVTKSERLQAAQIKATKAKAAKVSKFAPAKKAGMWTPAKKAPAKKVAKKAAPRPAKKAVRKMAKKMGR
jgi:hypothetical protein